jgi:GH25 family lysozyme M1 (1,4-beta-N-acetylmuramidase)
LQGTDIYEGDTVDNWATLKAQKLFFIFMRVHYGTKLDTMWADYWKAAQAVGFRSGGYGFLLPSQPWQDQVAVAAQAVQSIGGFKSGDMNLFVDLESPKSWLKLPSGTMLSQNQRDRIHKQIITAWIKAMPSATTRTDFLLHYLHGIQQAIGRTVGIYTSASFMEKVFPNPPAELTANPLWVANWDVNTPDVPGPWSRLPQPQWQLWQDKGDSVSYDGLNENKPNSADRDWFWGTLADFEALFGTPA